MRPSHIVAVVGVLVCGSVAVPGAPAPQLVREEIAANHLTLDPQVEHLRSTLVIEGRSIDPIVRQFPSGGRVSVPLVTEDGEGLPDGSYRYLLSLVYTEEEKSLEEIDAMAPNSFEGVFFVLDGAPMARSRMRAALSEQRADLQSNLAEPGQGVYITSEFIQIEDNDGGGTLLRLETLSGSGAWDIGSPGGQLEMVPMGAVSGERVVIDENGLSVGTFGGGSGNLHVQDTSPSIKLYTDDQAQRWNLYVNPSVGEFRVRDNVNFDHILAVEAGAGNDRFFAAGNGRIGLGTDLPDSDLHLVNADGAGDTTLKLARSGTGSWNLGHTATGVFTFSRVGTGGQEFTVRNRNHATATLDVQGHVRGTSFKSTSSRALKTGFEALDAAEVLTKLEQLPVLSWRYRTEADEVRHVGPVAEDFQRLFGLGDGRTIASIDADGVALAAIQGLIVQVAEQDEAIGARDEEITALKQRIAALESLLSVD